MTTRTPFDLLLGIALDLNLSLTSGDRYSRLVNSVAKALECDAAVLFRVSGEELLPLNAHGLRAEGLGHTYLRREHPRLDLICSSREPTRFPADSPLPDPFDGLLADAHGIEKIHACLGCPLWVEDELVGVLSLDARKPYAFDRFEDRYLTALSALTAAVMRTSTMMDVLEQHARHQDLVARDLIREAGQQRGHLLLGNTPTMVRLREEISLYARSDFPVLILGETGTGKELVVRDLHARSPRAVQPLIYVNCAALPESIAESELFGHVKGAFTGATTSRAGKFEVAKGGTLFLDEIGELPLSLQPKLLRALQEGEIQRVGSDQTTYVDVRILAATNRNLPTEVEKGRFRADLFHRLDVCRIQVPALRERRADIALLAGHFSDRTRRRLGLGPVRITPQAMDVLAGGPWPGNVRELDNLLSRSILLASERTPAGETVVVTPEVLGMEGEPALHTREITLPPPVAAVAPVHLREAVNSFQRELIHKALAASSGNWAAAARELGMHRSNLHHLAKRLGLDGERRNAATH
jgi:anaerobic nitric oxide reductase transcription regulator